MYTVYATYLTSNGFIQCSTFRSKALLAAIRGVPYGFEVSRSVDAFLPWRAGEG